MTGTKKALLLLYPSRYNDINQLALSVFTLAAENNLKVIKTFYAENYDDCDMLQELVQIVKAQNETVTLIVKNHSYSSFSKIITSTVLGTLEMSGLIDICLYEEPMKFLIQFRPLKLYFLTKEEINFFPIAFFHLQQLMAIIKRKLLHSDKRRDINTSKP